MIHISTYIATDTRHTVPIGDKTDLVVRIQNFGTRYDTRFKNGQRVMVFWAISMIVTAIANRIDPNGSPSRTASNSA